MAPKKRQPPGNRPCSDHIPARTTTEIAAALNCRWLWRLIRGLLLTVLATLEGGYDTVFPQGRLRVTVISHLFRQPGPVAVLTHFVIKPAGFGLLVPGIRSAVVFLPRQRSARFAVPVAAVARPADPNLLLTSLAVEKAAI